MTYSEQVRKYLDDNTTAGVEWTAKALGASRTHGYTACQSGEWPSVKIGARYRIPTAWIREQLLIDA